MVMTKMRTKQWNLFVMRSRKITSKSRMSLRSRINSEVFVSAIKLTRVIIFFHIILRNVHYHLSFHAKLHKFSSLYLADRLQIISMN